MVGWLLKLLASLIVLVIGLLGGLFPIFIHTNEQTKTLLFYGESFAGGVFLGAGLIHLLPDAQSIFTHLTSLEYPYMFVLCAFSILALRIIEDGMTKLFTHKHHMDHLCLACLLTVVLSIHSVLAGIALGTLMSFASFLVIFIAIIAHKGSAAFALGVNVRKAQLSRRGMIQLIVVFSLMTPLGILFGTVFSSVLSVYSGQMAAAMFNAIAAGTFIYMAAFHGLKRVIDKDLSTLKHLSFFTLGLVMMAVTAVWL